MTDATDFQSPPQSGDAEWVTAFRVTQIAPVGPPARQPIALLADRADPARILELEDREENRTLSENTAPKEHVYSLAFIAAASRIVPFPHWGINE